MSSSSKDIRERKRNSRMRMKVQRITRIRKECAPAESVKTRYSSLSTENFVSKRALNNVSRDLSSDVARRSTFSAPILALFPATGTAAIRRYRIYPRKLLQTLGGDGP